MKIRLHLRLLTLVFIKYEYRLNYTIVLHTHAVTKYA